MSHEKYSPVGYIYQADQYCLDCIPSVAAKPNEYGFPAKGKGNKPAVTKRNGGNGYRRGECNCTECRLDRMAKARGIDRYDERSFDSGDFPKAISYFNDIHAECGPESYGYGAHDPEWKEQYCDATCGKCHSVIDGVSSMGRDDICPVFAHRKEQD